MDALPILVRGPSQNRFERRDYRCVKLSLYSLSQPQSRDPTWHRVAIGSVRGHGVVCVGDSDDACDQGNLYADESVLVAAAVHSVVMVSNGPTDPSVIINLAENYFADDR